MEISTTFGVRELVAVESWWLLSFGAPSLQLDGFPGFPF